MKAKIYIGAKKYALYIGRKIVEKTLEFLTLPARFVSNKVQDLKNLTMWGQSVQTSARTRNLFDKNSTPLNAYVTNQGMFAHSTSKTWVIEVKPNTTYTLSYDNSMIDTNPRCYIVGFENKPTIGSTDATSYYMSNNATKHTIAFTTDNNINYITLWLVYSLETVVIQEALSTAQLEEGSTATPYVPYIATTPTPDTPIPVESVGGRTKNLFDEQGIGYFSSSRTVYGVISYSNGKLIYNFTPSTNGGRNSIGSNSFYLEAGTYTVSYPNLKELNIYLVKEDTFGSHDGGTNMLTTSGTFTIQEKTPFHFGLSVLSGKDYNEAFNIQIEKSSTPTPYEPYGYKIPVTVSGKNLFNPDDLINAYPTCFEVDKKTGGIKLINWKSDLYSTGITVDWKAGSTISFTPISTGTNMSANARVRVIGSAGSNQVLFITDENGNTNPPQKLTVTQNIVQMRFDHTKSNADMWGLENFMVSEEDIPFEPYIEPTTANIYLNEPLRKIGEYSDYIDLESQKVVRNIGENIITGADCGGFYQGVNALRMTIGKLQDTTKGEIEIPYVSNSFIWGGFEANKGIANTITGSPLAVRCWMWFEHGTFTNNEEAKAYIDTKNIIIYNVLATPTEEIIDIPAINIAQGDLTLNIDTIVKPSKIEITGDIDNVD